MKNLISYCREITIRSTFLSALWDDYGVSQETWDMIVKYELLPKSVLDKVTATDGRFYLKGENE